MPISKRSTDRGTWRMGVGAVLLYIGIMALGQGGALQGLTLIVLSGLLCWWGWQRAFVGPSIPRLGRLLERAGRELSAR